MWTKKLVCLIVTLLGASLPLSESKDCNSLLIGGIRYNTPNENLRSFEYNKEAKLYPLCTKNADCNFLCDAASPAPQPCCVSNTCLCQPKGDICLPATDHSLLMASYDMICNEHGDLFYYGQVLLKKDLKNTDELNFYLELVPGKYLITRSLGRISKNQVTEYFFNYVRQSFYRLFVNGIAVSFINPPTRKSQEQAFISEYSNATTVAVEIVPNL